MTNYENVTCEMSPLDAAMYEIAELRQQLEAERAAHSLTRVNMAWQIMDLKCREVK
jgi:hypothetical protein